MYKSLLIASLSVCIVAISISCKKTKEEIYIYEQPVNNQVPIGFKEVSTLATLRTAACIKLNLNYSPNESGLSLNGLPNNYLAGIVYSPNSDFSIDLDTIKNSDPYQTEYQIFDLSPDKLYYFKAFYKKKTDNKFHESEIKTFTTKNYTSAGTSIRINNYNDIRSYYNGTYIIIDIDDFPYADIMSLPEEQLNAANGLLREMGVLYKNGVATDLKGGNTDRFHTDCMETAGIQEYKIFIDGLFTPSNSINNLGTYALNIAPSLYYTTLPRGSKVVLEGINPSDFSATYYEKPIIKIGGNEYQVLYEVVNNITKYYFNLPSNFPVGNYSLTYKVLCSEIAVSGMLNVVK